MDKNQNFSTNIKLFQNLQNIKTIHFEHYLWYVFQNISYTKLERHNVTVAVRKHVMVAVSPHVTVPGRVCMSVSAQGYVSSVSMEEEKL